MDQISPEIKNSTRERIVTGHIHRTVWWLAWPSIITMLFQTANMLADAYFVGKLGRAALSSVGWVSQLMLILMSISAAVGVGTTALVARSIGANEPEQAGQATRQSVLLAVVIATLSGGLIFLSGPTLIALMGGKGEALRLGVIYLNILLLGNIPFFLMFILSGVYRGMGDTRTPLLVMSIAVAIALAGDYLLIFGVGPFPRLGIAGAGLASVISRSVAAVMFLAFLPRSPLGAAVHGSWGPALNWFGRILHIGSPAAVQGILRTAASMAFIWVLARTPQVESAVAALTIGIRMEALAFMPGFAFSVAATSMVGQNLGAGLTDRAERGAWAATWQSIWVTGMMGLIFIVFARPIASVFTDDPAVLTLATWYLQINGISEPFLAMAMVLVGALEGAGETRFPNVAMIVTQWFIRLPLAYVLAVTLGLHAVGAWIAMSSSTILSGLAMLAVFKWSKWQEIEV